MQNVKKDRKLICASHRRFSRRAGRPSQVGQDEALAELLRRLRRHENDHRNLQVR